MQIVHEMSKSVSEKKRKMSSICRLLNQQSGKVNDA